MADITKLDSADALRGLGGKWHESAKPQLEAVAPNEEPIMMGPNKRTGRTGEFTRHCALCNLSVWLNAKDQPEIDRHPGMKFICEPCYFNLPTEA
jgi:hypothetical protein